MLIAALGWECNQDLGPELNNSRMGDSGARRGEWMEASQTGSGTRQERLVQPQTLISIWVFTPDSSGLRHLPAAISITISGHLCHGQVEQTAPFPRPTTSILVRSVLRCPPWEPGPLLLASELKPVSLPSHDSGPALPCQSLLRPSQLCPCPAKFCSLQL